MSEDSAASLRNYQIQLEQVEAALITDPHNEELIKLKSDLSEVIALTRTLMNLDGGGQTSKGEVDEQVTHQFEPGESCLAPLSEDGQYYEAQLEDVTSDGQCTVIFSQSGRKITEVCLVSLLKPLQGKKKGGGKSGASNAKVELNRMKRQEMQQQRDYVKKKQQKKKDRLKGLEEEGEKEKSKWQQFTNKASSKHLKGAAKKSIFASPESVIGRVGVGTCGTGGQPMTEFSQADKWKKKMAMSVSSHSKSSHSHSSSSSSSHSHRYK